MKASKLIEMLQRETLIWGDLDVSICGRDCEDNVTLTVHDTEESECCGMPICDGDICRECKEHTESIKYFELEQ